MKKKELRVLRRNAVAQMWKDYVRGDKTVLEEGPVLEYIEALERKVFGDECRY